MARRRTGRRRTYEAGEASDLDVEGAAAIAAMVALAVAALLFGIDVAAARAPDRGDALGRFGHGILPRRHDMRHRRHNRLRYWHWCDRHGRPPLINQSTGFEKMVKKTLRI